MAPMLGVALLVIPSILLEATNVGEPWHTVGVVLDWAIWLAFLGEFVVMLSVTPSVHRYLLRHPIEVAVVVLTPPFLGRVFTGLRTLRLLQAVRLLRLQPVIRWLFSNTGLRYAALFILLVILASGEAFSVLENVSFWQGTYWAVLTATTIGDANWSPTTVESKVVEVLLLMVGVCSFAAFTGVLAERMLEQRTQDEAAAGADAALDDVALATRLDALTHEVVALRAAVAGRGGGAADEG